MSTSPLKPLLDRMEEIRSRLIRTGLVIISLTIAAYVFRGKVLDFLQKPLKEDLIFIHPTEAFFTYIKISLFAGLLIGIPYVVFQFVRFFYPSLKGKGKVSWVFWSLLFFAGTVFFYLGAGFALKGVLPYALRFLKSISGESLEAVFTIGNYASFVISFTLIFGFIFEIPIVAFGLARAGFLTKETLISKWRIIIAGAAVLAAILTPPDPITQMFLWGPLLFLYGLSIILVSIGGGIENK